jgi:hypothetical protein
MPLKVTENVGKIAAMLILLSSSFVFSSQSEQARNVSLLELITSPEKFDGQLIAVVGFLEMSRDGDLLYLHRADDENWIVANSVWIRRDERLGKDRNLLNRKYVKVVGIFKVGYHEQLGYPPNGISDVRSAKVWSNPDSPIGRKNIPGVNSGP